MNNKKILTIIRGEEFKLSLKEKIETTDIFYDQYLEAANMLDDIVAINDDEKRADWRRVETENNIIAFCGDRGEGKSSVMMTFINALSNKDAWNQDPIFSSCEHVKRTAFSRPVFIDPSTFDHVHNILEVVVARLYREYRVRYENDPGAFENEKCGKLLEKFQKVYRIISLLNNPEKMLEEEFDGESNIANLAKMGEKVSLAMRLYCPFSSMYLFAMNNCVTGLKNIRNYARESKTFIRDCNRVGLKKGIYLAKFRKQRRTAFTDINALMPEMDSRISSIISDLKLKPEQETVEKNIFVFWWDGFEKAPSVVKKCIKSVEDNYSGFNVIRISKDNYKNYTDIDPMVLEGFEAGKISVQTFSDILRFNLLKNNGGMWIDATIFFVNNYDLIGRLGENQSFNTLEFASSREFLNYKGFACSWSGFFIASKKNGLFVRTMDAIFREYYKKYGTYTLYFFIDAAFMTCKINGVDDDVLMKSQKCDGDMFLLSKVGNYPYNEACMTEIGKLPQKLAWNIELSKNERTFYTMLLN